MMRGPHFCRVLVDPEFEYSLPPKQELGSLDYRGIRVLMVVCEAFGITAAPDLGVLDSSLHWATRIQ